MQNFLQNAEADIAKNREAVIERLVEFSLTDMLLFWGQEKDLIARQEKFWGPILEWAKDEFKAKFVTTNGLDVPEENRQAGYRMKEFLESLSDKELTAFYAAALDMKSVLLAAALVKGRITAQEAFDAAFLDELWQAENWGNDEEADKKRREMKQELETIGEYLKSR